MPMRWIVREYPLKTALEGLMLGEPFFVGSDIEGEAQVVFTREEIDVPADPSKATEVIGTQAEFPAPDPNDKTKKSTKKTTKKLSKQTT